MTTVRRRTTSKKERGIWGHEQVSSNGDGGERRDRGYGKEESNNASEGWSGENTEDLAGSATEEEAMTAGGAEWESETRTATPWGMQDRGAGAIHGDARAGRGDTGKSPSAAVNETEARGCYGARPAQKGGQGARRKKHAEKTLGVRGDDRGRNASRVVHESPEWGTRRGAARPQEWRKTHRGPARELAGESSYHREPTPPEWQRCPGGTNHRRDHSNRGRNEEGWKGVGRRQTPHHNPYNQGIGSRRRQRRADGRAEDGRAAGPTAEHGGGRRQHRDPVKARRRHRQRQARAQRDRALQVRVTGANGGGGRPSRCGRPQ